jgi:hypothetical protein
MKLLLLTGALLMASGDKNAARAPCFRVFVSYLPRLRGIALWRNILYLDAGGREAGFAFIRPRNFNLEPPLTRSHGPISAQPIQLLAFRCRHIKRPFVAAAPRILEFASG